MPWGPSPPWPAPLPHPPPTSAALAQALLFHPSSVPPPGSPASPNLKLTSNRTHLHPHPKQRPSTAPSGPGNPARAPQLGIQDAPDSASRALASHSLPCTLGSHIATPTAACPDDAAAPHAHVTSCSNSRVTLCTLTPRPVSRPRSSPCSRDGIHHMLRSLAVHGQPLPRDRSSGQAAPPACLRSQRRARTDLVLSDASQKEWVNGTLAAESPRHPSPLEGVQEDQSQSQAALKRVTEPSR